MKQLFIASQEKEKSLPSKSWVSGGFYNNRVI
jgi:hypothetical protein